MINQTLSPVSIILNQNFFKIAEDKTKAKKKPKVRK